MLTRRRSTNTWLSPKRRPIRSEKHLPRRPLGRILLLYPPPPLGSLGAPPGDALESGPQATVTHQLPDYVGHGEKARRRIRPPAPTGKTSHWTPSESACSNITSALPRNPRRLPVREFRRPRCTRTQSCRALSLSSAWADPERNQYRAKIKRAAIRSPRCSVHPRAKIFMPEASSVEGF